MNPILGPSFEDLTNTFVLSSLSTPNAKQVLYEVPKALAGDASRQRRAHRKSKAGCEGCKRRRVKCDEKNPCASCVRRGQPCQRPQRRKSAPSNPSLPAQVSVLKPVSTNDNVNLLHLKLLHHFQTATVQTLLFSPAVWEHALQLSFEFDFLSNAILCVAARHLAVLNPEDTVYTTAAARHSSRALSRFRQELGKDFTSTNIDAFIATSFLLQFELWTNTEDYSSLQGGDSSLRSPGPSGDLIFSFWSTLKKVFLKCVPLLLGQPSVFMSYVCVSPKDMLVEAAQISDDTLTAYQNFFSYYRPLATGSLDLPPPYARGTNLAIPERWQYTTPVTEHVPDPIEDGYTPIISQLCLILSFLPEAQPPDSVSAESSLLPELAKYILSFPVMCHGPMNSMIQKGDPHALLLVYHFYRAVRVLLAPSKCWWVHKRATVCEAALKAWLTRKSAE